MGMGMTLKTVMPVSGAGIGVDSGISIDSFISMDSVTGVGLDSDIGKDMDMGTGMDMGWDKGSDMGSGIGLDIDSGIGMDLDVDMDIGMGMESGTALVTLELALLTTDRNMASEIALFTSEQSPSMASESESFISSSGWTLKTGQLASGSTNAPIISPLKNFLGGVMSGVNSGRHSTG